MKFLDSIANRFGFFRARPEDIKEAAYRNRMMSMRRPTTRAFSGADMSRLTADWMTTGSSADVELRTIVKTLRNRARDGERNEDYIRRYLSLRHNNVIGAQNFHLRVDAKTPGNQPDEKAQKLVEGNWSKWNRKEFCTVTRKLTWNQVTELALRSEGRDGGSLVQKVRGFSNSFGYAIRPMEMDFLAIDLNVVNSKTEIRLGVEVDQWGSPVNYYIYNRHPGDTYGVMPSQQAVPIPADQMLHIYKPERFGQTIGAPEVSAGLLTMKMLRAYQEAEITASREAACKGYGIEQTQPASFQGEAEDSQGRQLQPVEPGMGLLLDPGQKYFSIDPNHPVDAFGDFCKSIIRSFAAGMGVSYNSLANDLEGVNYSSIRAGLLEERAEWEKTQGWLIDDLYNPVFEDWLAWSLFYGTLAPLTMADFERLNHPVWTPRGWDWVDPEKDVNASIKAIGARLISREQVIAQSGGSIKDVDAAFAKDPVTSDIDTESVYAPDSKETEPQDAEPKGQPVPVVNGNGNTRLSLH